MYQSKNCGHGFDLFVKGTMGRKTDGVVYGGFVEFEPIYCPICGKKIERKENDS